MTTIFEREGYIAAVANRCCVVHRVVTLPREQRLITHVGEKHESQDWREVNLIGCPDEIRVQIVQAWRNWEKQNRI